MSFKTEPIQIRAWDEVVTVVAEFAGRYGNDTPVVALRNAETGAPEGRLTIALPDEVELADNEIIVKTWSENEPYRALLMTSWFNDTGRRIPAGFTVAEVWTTDIELPKGY